MKTLATFALLAVTASSACFAKSSEKVEETYIPIFSKLSYTCNVMDFGVTELDADREHCENDFKRIKGQFGGYNVKDLKLGNVISVYRGKQYSTGEVWITYEVIKK